MTGPQEALRKCKTCGESKPETGRFFPAYRYRLGFEPVCIICRRANTAAWKVKNKETMLSKQRTRYLTTVRARLQQREDEERLAAPHLFVAKTLCHGMRQRIRTVGYAASPQITPAFIAAWLEESPNCPCCGVEFEIRKRRQGIALKSSPSLDRFDPAKGYTLDNIEIICFRCNHLKRQRNGRGLHSHSILDAQSAAEIAPCDSGGRVMSAAENALLLWNEAAARCNWPLVRGGERKRARRFSGFDEKLAFWTMPEPNSGCLLWLGEVTEYGYVRAKWRNKGVERMNRAVWEHTHGPIPAGLHVLHKCDVRSCLNVAHFFLGTNTENVVDKMAKGRHRSPSGPDHWRRRK